MAVTPTIDEARLEAFMERFVGELGACATAPMVLIGEKLGLYKAMQDSEPVTPAELAERTGTNERYIREWLCQQAASEYLEYEAADGTFRLPPEQALALAVDESPAFIPGAFQLLAAMIKDEPAISDMGDTGGAAQHVRTQLADDGTWLVVEPMAFDSVEENLNPVGRVFYAGSTMLCTPASLSQEVGLALGAQAGPKRLTEVLNQGGFSHVRRAAETPFNLVLEVRP